MLSRLSFNRRAVGLATKRLQTELEQQLVFKFYES